MRSIGVPRPSARRVLAGSAAGEACTPEPWCARDHCPVKRRRLMLTERIEIGKRDGWLCGVCQDPAARPAERPAA